MRRASNGLIRAVLSRSRVPRTTEVRKISSGQIGQIVGNGLIQTVANSSPIWRGWLLEHFRSGKDGRVFEVRPGLKFCKPPPGTPWSRRREVESTFNSKTPARLKRGQLYCGGHIRCDVRRPQGNLRTPHIWLVTPGGALEA